MIIGLGDDTTIDKLLESKKKGSNQGTWRCTKLNRLEHKDRALSVAAQIDFILMIPSIGA